MAEDAGLVRGVPFNCVAIGKRAEVRSSRASDDDDDHDDAMTMTMKTARTMTMMMTMMMRTA